MSSSTDLPVWGDASKEPRSRARSLLVATVTVVTVVTITKGAWPSSPSPPAHRAPVVLGEAQHSASALRERAARHEARAAARARAAAASCASGCANASGLFDVSISGLTGERMPYARLAHQPALGQRGADAYDAAVLVQHGDAGHAHDHLCIVWGAIVEALGEAAAARVLVVAPQFFDDALAAAAAASPDDDAGGARLRWRGRGEWLQNARSLPAKALEWPAAAPHGGDGDGAAAPAFAVSSHDVFDELIGALAEATARGEDDGAVDSELPRAARPRRALVVVGVGRAGELLEQFAVSPRGRQHTDEAAAAARGVPPVSWLLGADNDDDGESWGAAASHELAPGAMLHDELIAHLTQ